MFDNLIGSELDAGARRTSNSKPSDTREAVGEYTYAYAKNRATARAS